MLIGVAEAAKRLGVSVRRVNAMITAGQIPAERVSKSWVIRARDLPLPRTTRPLSFRSAWTVLLEFDEISWIPASNRSRLKKRFTSLRDREDRLDVFRSWMASRGKAVRFDLPSKQELLADQRFIPSGVSNHLSELLGGVEIEGYVSSDSYAQLLKYQMLMPANEGDLILRECPIGISSATRLMVAADLAERNTSRELHQALRLLDEVLEEQ